ncbi:cellulase family glycosylhydrolase [Raoultella scottii]|uniref:cellulase family glycosylhydrolase n=1 Tax=Raoultella scottii TaxID=3040937 RepID=UPI002FA81ADC
MNIIRHILPIVFCVSSLLTAPANSIELGIGTHFQSYKNPPTVYLDILKKYGFTSFRDDYSWSKIESSPGVYSVSKNLEKTDFAIQNGMKYNLNPVVILDYGNALYNSGHYPSDSESIAAFSKYAAWTAERFKGKVKYYEIWNEWTLGTGMVKFRDEIPPADVYFELVKKTSEEIRKVDPNAVIIAGSINPLEQRARYIELTDWEWFKKLVSLGMMNYIDGVSLHTYSYLNRDKNLRTPIGNLEYLDKFHSYFSKIAGKDIDVYITETGVTNYNGPGGLSIEESAAYIKEYTKEARKRKYIKGLWWYDLINDGDDPFKREHNFGFFSKNLTPKKSALEIKNTSR